MRKEKQVKRVRIIASNPASGQSGIDDLIGRIYNVESYEGYDDETIREMKELNEVFVLTERGMYLLNEDEYEYV